MPPFRSTPLLVPNMDLSKRADPVFPHFWAFFGTFVFCVSNPIENVVCSVVQATGRVHVGVKVVVQLQSHVLMCSRVYAGAGLLGTLL